MRLSSDELPVSWRRRRADEDELVDVCAPASTRLCKAVLIPPRSHAALASLRAGVDMRLCTARPRTSVVLGIV